MKLTLNDSLFDEIFQIISTNESKANSLRQSLLKNNNFDNNDELNMKIIQSLGEFEYDLKTLYRIVRDLKLSYNDIHNTLINSNNKKEEGDNKIKFDYLNKYKKGKIYFNEFENKLKEGNKTYYMSSSKVNYNNNNRCKNIKEYYINSYHRPENARKFQRSMSCKSYIGNWNNNNDKNNYNSFNNENKIPNDLLSYNDSNYINDKFMDSYFSDKDKDLKLNFDYDSYLTDYTLNKTTKKDPNSPKNIISNSNIPKESLSLSDLKNENNYDVPSKYINNKIDIDNNNNKKYLNQSQNNNDLKENNNNNIFTFADPKTSQNLDKDLIATFDPKYINKNNMINKEINNEYLDNQYNNDKNNKYSYEDFINDKYNKNDNNNKYQLNDNEIENKEINNNYTNEEENNNNVNNNNVNNNNVNNNNNLKNNNINNNNDELNKNNYLNYNFDGNDDNKIVNNNKEDEDNLEDKKKEKIKYIVSEIFQNPNTFDLLKRKLGDDIGEKLLSGNINEEDLFKVVEILKKNQDYINNRNNSIKKPKRYFPKKKFNQPSDKVLLKELLKEKRYNYREFPRGWSSTKDFFVNNGSTFLKDRSRKKYYN